MSFAYDVKKELSVSIDSARHCKIAELVAITSNIGEYVVMPGGKILLSYQSENELVISTVYMLVRKLFHVSPDVSVLRSTDWKGKIYTLSIRNSNLASKMLLEMGLMKANGALYDLSLSQTQLIPKKNCCKRAFLKGKFLCIGTISDPKKSYHIEFSCVTKERADDVKLLIDDFEIESRISKRKNRYVVYVKDGEKTSDILTLIGATSSLLEFENVRILRDISGNVNRQVNCETANINKRVTAGMKQVKQIEAIRDKRGLSSLPPELREVAKVRLANPDMGIKELGESLSPPLGKSGVYHRLERIKRIYEEL